MPVALRLATAQHSVPHPLTKCSRGPVRSGMGAAAQLCLVQFAEEYPSRRCHRDPQQQRKGHSGGAEQCRPPPPLSAPLLVRIGPVEGCPAAVILCISAVSLALLQVDHVWVVTVVCMYGFERGGGGDHDYLAGLAVALYLLCPAPCMGKGESCVQPLRLLLAPITADHIGFALPTMPSWAVHPADLYTFPTRNQSQA